MKRFGILFWVILTAAGCRNLEKSMVSPAAGNDVVKEIQRVKENIFRVYASADYDTYTFESSEHIRDEELHSDLLKNKPGSFNRNSSLGTATLILKNNSHQVFLTCFHIFNYPDTIKQYYYRSDGSKTAFLSSISIKTKQDNFIKMSGQTFPLQFIAVDSTSDLAFLTTVSPPKNPIPFHSEFIPEPAIIDGSEAIIFGYPSGYDMTTRATVSKQKQTNRIILDASFNQGFSGAPFFVADETGRLMLAGIVTAAASSTKNILVPEFQSHEKQYNPNNPYKGNIFAEVDERIRYGITFTLNSGEIKDFYIENKHLFNNKNISLHRVFNLGNL